MSPMHEEVIARQREALQQAASNTVNTSSSSNQPLHLQGLNMPLVEPRPGDVFLNTTLLSVTLSTPYQLP